MAREHGPSHPGETQVSLTPMMQAQRQAELPRWMWLYLPFAILVVQIAARLAGDEAYQTWMRSEISVPELGAVFWLLVAVAGGLLLLRDRERLLPSGSAILVALFTLGCFYFAGEEASWGQHYFGWKTPESFAALNDQGETGLHNLSGIGVVFDQLPRNLLTLAAIVAVLAPGLARAWPERFGSGSRLHWLMPTYVCIPAALLAVLVRYMESIAQWAGDTVAELMDMQAGELKEYFLALFLALYILSLRARRSAGVRTSGGGIESPRRASS